MPSRAASATQQALVARLQAAGATKGQIAEHAGVDASMVSKWIADSGDQREMTLDAVRRLADVYGWAVVLGPIAAAAGWSIANPGAAPAADLLRAGIDLCSEAADIPQTIVRLMAAGKLDTPEGRETIRREIREARHVLDGLEAAIDRRIA